MKADDILGRVREAATVRQVFGEPYERDGMLVVPVAHVRGGGGGGGGTQEGEGGGSGWGGGLGIDARPVGVYVIRDGDVEWRPAVDVTRIVLQGQKIVITALIVGRRVARRLRAR